MDLGNPIAKGNTADIYLCDKKIIKVLKDYLPETEAIKEADKQRLAWKAGLPVPEILDVIKIENRQAVVMEYITGDTLDHQGCFNVFNHYLTKRDILLLEISALCFTTIKKSWIF